MKYSFTTFLAATLFVMSGLYGQEVSKEGKVPKWVSKKGFWQIETNIHTPTKNIVSFFSNDRTLIYKENVDGVVLDLKRSQVKKRLKRALERALLTWEKDRLYRSDQRWISMLFKN
jgi:hypothetical protein